MATIGRRGLLAGLCAADGGRDDDSGRDRERPAPIFCDGALGSVRAPRPAPKPWPTRRSV